MTGEEWFVIAGACPVVVGAGAFNTYRIWKKRADIGPAVSWAVGDSGVPGMAAAQLPMTGTFALMFLSLVTAQIWDPDVAPWGAIPVTFFALTILGFILSFWVWLFMTPKFLVPPYLRGQPGWIKGAWLRRQADRKAAKQSNGRVLEHRAKD